MGFIKNIFANWISRRYDGEITKYLTSLKGMDNGDLGGVLMIATHVRNTLEPKYNTSLLEPFNIVQNQPFLLTTISNAIKIEQKNKNLTFASGLMVWLHTLRGAFNPEIRYKAKLMWAELERGKPYVEQIYNDTYIHFKTLSKIDLNIEGFNETPIGFSFNGQERISSKLRDMQILEALKKANPKRKMTFESNNKAFDFAKRHNNNAYKQDKCVIGIIDKKVYTHQDDEYPEYVVVLAAPHPEYKQKVLSKSRTETYTLFEGDLVLWSPEKFENSNGVIAASLDPEYTEDIGWKVKTIF